MDATTQMSEADYETVLTAAAELGRTEPDLDGKVMFQRLGLVDDDQDGGFIADLARWVGSAKRVFAIRRAFLSNISDRQRPTLIERRDRMRRGDCGWCGRPAAEGGSHRRNPEGSWECESNGRWV
jgi:hypothetical protein